MSTENRSVSITFVEPSGTTRPCRAHAGKSLMETAVDHGVEGVVGECGGSATCGTCHVHLDERFVAVVPPLTDREDAVLESGLNERLPTSRLACQIAVARELDGMVVTVPALPW
ncbi:MULTISPECIES: 2Fe-2S iron-sulfur cluster-binding protein [unclassified Mycolicibacterium]|uniref:2Fe-2S iron-sulfur cluster-binding protein n=1 Tax=unclassified Mycolicibacterium TaxID=2636767 RepID=UPI002ED818DF